VSCDFEELCVSFCVTQKKVVVQKKKTRGLLVEGRSEGQRRKKSEHVKGSFLRANKKVSKQSVIQLRTRKNNVPSRSRFVAVVNAFKVDAAATVTIPNDCRWRRQPAACRRFFGASACPSSVSDCCFFFLFFGVFRS
jgi:hypothetical protein